MASNYPSDISDIDDDLWKDYYISSDDLEELNQELNEELSKPADKKAIKRKSSEELPNITQTQPKRRKIRRKRGKRKIRPKWHNTLVDLLNDDSDEPSTSAVTSSMNSLIIVSSEDEDQPEVNSR